MTARTLLIAALASCAMSSVATESAHADGKTYPGSMCRRFTGPELTMEPLETSAMFNPSTTVGMRVDCPIVKDVVASGLDHVTVRVVDGHPTQNVCCELVTNKFESNRVIRITSGVKCSSGSSGPEPINFDKLIGYKDSKAHWYLSCSIPPVVSGNPSAIFNYYVLESPGRP